jgi:hypothetical protein
MWIWRFPVEKRDVRRGLVLWVFALCAAMVVAPIDWLRGHFLLFVVPILILNYVLRRATRRVAVAKDEMLDERDLAVRDRAYRLSYKVLAVIVGVPLWLALFSSSGSTGWLANAASNTGLILTYLELFFFLPTLIVAWREPDGPEKMYMYWRLTTSQKISVALLVVVLLFPVVSSVTLAFSSSSSSQHRVLPASPYPGAHTATTCGYFGAQKSVGSFAQAEIQLSTGLCWNGKRIWQQWGLNLKRGDCERYTASLASVSVHCRMQVSKDGTMDVLYHADVTATLLPFLHRTAEIRLVVRPDGHVVRFPS